MIAADVRWKAEHLAREASQTRKLVTLSLIRVNRQMIFRKGRISDIFDNEWLVFEVLVISGKLSILCSIRHGHNSTLHVIEGHSMKFLTLGLMWNI